MSLNINVSGVWKAISQLYVNVSGTWKQCIDVYVKTGGTWKSVLYQAGTQEYAAGSSGTFTVPAGVYSLTLSMIGGGGNGNGNTDYHPAAGGGSGGYFNNVTVSVTPYQTISYAVGSAGATNNVNPYQWDGGDTTFGSLTAGGGKGGHWRGSNTPYPSDEHGGEAGTYTGTGGSNGTAGNDSAKYGGNGNGASSPFGTGGSGTSSGSGGSASGYGAGGGGGGNNAGGGAGSGGRIWLSW